MKKFPTLQKGITVIIVLLIIMMPFKQHKFPRPLDYENSSIKMASDWIKNNHLDNQKIYCATPFMWQVLNKDPFDSTQSAGFDFIDKQYPEKNIRSGNIIIWDSHFSPNEGGVALQKLTENPSFRQLDRFETNPNLVPKEKGEFEVSIFQKI
jgi:hypothetical protein